jgi:hypothetical protein
VGADRVGRGLVMPRLLGEPADGEDTTRFGAQALYVHGIVYENSASKFWSGLFDEILEDWPGCDKIILSTADSARFTRSLLYPQDSLEDEFEELAKLDFEQVLRETVEQLSLSGGPTSVTLSLFEGQGELRSLELPLECVDSMVFAYLVAWLFEWCEVPETDWNEECIEGSFSAEDVNRHLCYCMQFAFSNAHMSEGLFMRSATIGFERKRVRQKQTDNPG